MYTVSNNLLKELFECAFQFNMSSEKGGPASGTDYNTKEKTSAMPHPPIHTGTTRCRVYNQVQNWLCVGTELKAIKRGCQESHLLTLSRDIMYFYIYDIKQMFRFIDLNM